MPRRNLSEIVKSGPASPDKLAHIVVRTTQVAILKEWYLTVLAAEISYENEMLCFMSYDDEHHRIGIVQKPGLSGVAVDEKLPGLEHVAFTYADLGRLLSTYRRLKSEGIVPYWTVNHGPTLSMYYRDPDGNSVELQVDVFATSAEVNAFLAANYAENFIGIVFDPEEVIRQYEEGVPLAELYRRPKLPPGLTPWDMVRN